MPFGGVGYLGDHIFHAPGAKLWHYAAEPRTLSVTYPFCGSALTVTTNNPSEMCPLKFTDFCLFLYHQSYAILQGPLIPRGFLTFLFMAPDIYKFVTRLTGLHAS